MKDLTAPQIIDAFDFLPTGKFSGVPRHLQLELKQHIDNELAKYTAAVKAHIETQRQTMEGELSQRLKLAQSDNLAFLEVALSEADRIPTEHKGLFAELAIFKQGKAFEGLTRETDERGRYVFRKDGNIVWGKEGEPKTAADFYREQLSSLFSGVKTGEAKPGGAIHKPTAENLPDVSKCKTLVDADNVIQAHLKGKGITPLKSASEYATEMQRLRVETGADQLPTGLKVGAN